ncbi:hypothetical protein BGZ99_004604 [Dissophora globulifera]|uniref:F-box domain-containing protein n=1 Tax=Dissophora globulifera TaxID=979702 RepID=A0A9P6RX01_9FUNG|nr:hypothetical protein BGZ99_004604 [Dissophora globulifera]
MGTAQSDLAQADSIPDRTAERNGVEPLSRQLSQLSLESYSTISNRSYESFEELDFDNSSVGFSDWSSGSVPASPTSLDLSITPAALPATPVLSASPVMPVVSALRIFAALSVTPTMPTSVSSLILAASPDLPSSPVSAPSPALSARTPFDTPTMDISIQMQVPASVWNRICSHLHPSQLARLSLVNKAAYNLVINLDIWSMMYKRMHGTPQILAPPLQLLPRIPDSHSYQLFMCAISRQVCEGCFRRCDGQRQRGRLAAMPLPVQQHFPSGWDRNETKLTTGKEEEERGEGWNVNLCRNCRVEYYQAHPEPIPHTIASSYLTRRAIKAKYHLGDKEISSITKRQGGGRKSKKVIAYHEPEALARAREAYGGDVGLQAVPKSLCKPVKVMHTREYLYELRRKITEHGGVWLTHDEFQARKTAGQLPERVW